MKRMYVSFVYVRGYLPLKLFVSVVVLAPTPNEGWKMPMSMPMLWMKGSES
jgi:hypothetical protein